MESELALTRKPLEEQFQQLVKAGRSHLTLDEVVQLRLPGSEWGVEACHLATLFVLDSDKSGRVTLPELQAFADVALQVTENSASHELATQLLNFYTMELFEAVSTEQGRTDFMDWLCRLLLENTKTGGFTGCDIPLGIHKHTMQTLYTVLHIQETQGLQFVEFFLLLQRVAVEQQLLPEHALAEPDEWVPLDTVQDFINNMISGMLSMMQDVCS